MPNPQQPDVARSRRSAATPESAAPTTATSRPLDVPHDAPGPVPEANQPGHAPKVVPDKPSRPHPAYADPGLAVRFPFATHPVLTPLAAVFGVWPGRAWVDVDQRDLTIRFGPWSLRTPIRNVAGCEVTGPYRAIKVAGPPHLSLADGGITFATANERGVCIRFVDPVPALTPFGRPHHPSATVTVADPEALVAALS